MKKNNIFKIFLCFVIVVVSSILFIKVLKHNNYNEISVKIVEELDSTLYDLIVFYKYNEDSGNYNVEKKYVRKENSIYEVFNYYNTDLKYNLSNISFENNVLRFNINSSEISLHTFKIMKLSYQSINIDKFIIYYNEKEIEI